MTGRKHDIDGVSSFFGFRWESPERMRFEIREDLINAGGMLSGAATYALIDYCMGSTLWPHTADDERIATISISVNYVQSATEGEIVCESQVDRRNRQGAVLRSEVRHEDGRLIATAIGSFTIFKRKPQ
jgi:acyl-coenzyme A thioesterase 13